MILAMIINWKETRCKGFWRFIFVLSIAVPQFVSLLIMRTMLQEQGAINVLLQDLGLISDALPFWTDATWARVTIIDGKYMDRYSLYDPSGNRNSAEYTGRII